MQDIDLPADELVSALLDLAKAETVCILDSCGVGHLGSHLLIAGLAPVSVDEITSPEPGDVLAKLDEAVSDRTHAAFFTLSYDVGKKMLGIAPRHPGSSAPNEPDVFIARFGAIVIHDYDSGMTRLVGNSEKAESIRAKLSNAVRDRSGDIVAGPAVVHSDFTRDQYLAAIEKIKERIRRGDTYQTNLTQQLAADLPSAVTAEQIFFRLRRDHPAPFAAYLRRLDSIVVSASPERFFRIVQVGSRREMSTSPIKGTRPRGNSTAEDDRLRRALLTSKKDIAENTMIVDLLRNDLGRVCEFGSVAVEKLCDLEEHPTLFHLVSTVRGYLRNDTSFSDIIRAVFPCGSITGAPKISTMQIIEEIETSRRGLSMGSIGYYLPPNWLGDSSVVDVSVAIRTMVVRDQTATFNVGGGIVIDSDPADEYDESLLKASALMNAIGGVLK